MPDFPKRRAPRRHRPLGVGSAHAVIEKLGGDVLAFHRDRVAGGYRLSPVCRSYRRRDGGITFTFVWRGRPAGVAITWSYRVRCMPEGL